MFIKSSCDKNSERINLNLISGYYPCKRAFSSDSTIYQICFYVGDSLSEYGNRKLTTWDYDTEVARDEDLEKIDGRCNDLGSFIQ